MSGAASRSAGSTLAGRARSSVGRARATISTPASMPRSISDRATCPCAPVTAIRMSVEIARQIGERRMTAILVGEDHLACRNSPIDRQRRIVPGEPVVVCGRVIIRHLVENFGVGFERHIAMRKADWHEDLPPVLGGEFDDHMLAECR